MSIHPRLRIGITIGPSREPIDGGYDAQRQSAVFLADALLQCPSVASVSLIHPGGRHTAVLPPPPSHLPTLDLVGFSAAKDGLDLLIELGAQVSWEQSRYLKQGGTRVIAYCCDPDSARTMRSALFVNPCYDDIWLTPQVAAAHQDYFEILRRTPTQTVPFIWSPAFLETRMAMRPHNGTYQPRSGPRQLCVLGQDPGTGAIGHEALLIAELAYRTRPDAIALVRVSHAHRAARDDMAFITLTNQLDLVREHKTLFLHPQDTASLLAHHTDLVITHNDDQALAPVHLEVCWQGFPLVHNARLCADLGYYYEDHQLHTASELVLAAIDAHDPQASHYLQRQRARIARHLPGDPALTQAYTGLLDALMRKPER